MKNTANFKHLEQDNVFVNCEVKDLSQLVGMPTRKGFEKAIVSEGTLVNVVSKSYGHLPNEKFFAAVEEKLIDAEIEYVTRSINRDNRSFAVDYILNDEKYFTEVKQGNDVIKPMLRFTNSYDGSNKTSGHFGFFRQVCSNGLHVAESKIGFSVKHRGEIAEIVLPEIGKLVETFFDNEFFTLRRKFEVLAEKPIYDLREFVKYTIAQTDLFQYQASEKNPEPSLNARLVMDTITREANVLGCAPNHWLGYNAFNELIHTKLKKPFEQQKALDRKLFATIMEQVN